MMGGFGMGGSQSIIINLDGRTFGTNMMEAALIAAAGKGRKLSTDELNQLLDQLGFEPQIQRLNG